MSSIGTIVRIIRPASQHFGRLVVVAGMGVVDPVSAEDDGRRYSLAAFDAESGEYVLDDGIEAEEWRTADLWPEWMDRVQISVYRSSSDNVGAVCSLSAFLRSERHRDQVLQIRQLPYDEQKEAKKHLPMATISGVFSPKRRIEHLSQYSWVMCIDIDADRENTGIWGEQLQGIPDLLRRLPWVAYVSHSCRGVGYFALVRVSMPSPDCHRQMFQQLQHTFRQMGVTIDRSCSDVSRPRFISYDADAWWNLEDEPVMLDTAAIEQAEQNAANPCMPQQPVGIMPSQQMNNLSPSQGAADSAPTQYRYSPAEWEWRKVELVVEEAEVRGVDVTGTYNECLMLGASLYCFGQPGYEMWWRLCQRRTSDHEYLRTKRELAVKWMSFARMNRMRTDEHRLDAFFKIFADSGITYKDAIERQKRERRSQYRYR